ncbi:MAG: glycosyltransferase family 39 protein [Actinobacteria bacterium]|nr:glycosyltransferase family 39 protein [Actinomycetota bacterium]
MTLVTEQPAAAATDPARTRPGLLLRVLVGLALAVGIAVRLHSQSAVWLDEALSINIARLPLSELPAALRQDGAPPLYYLLLHGWMAVFGTGTTAVRLLSTLFGLAAVGLAWLVGTRLRDSTTGWVAALLFAATPFLVRYSTETRMYALVTVLVLLGVLAVERALREPTLRRLWPVSVLTALLLLTHYWSLYLLAVLGLLLLGLSRQSSTARRVLVAQVAGGVLFLPWLPSFLFQLRHTGTPWVLPPKPFALVDALQMWTGGRTLAGGLLALLLAGLVVLALLGRRSGAGVLLTRPVDRLAGALVVVAVGTLVLGLGLAQLTAAGYAPRYSSVAVVPFLLAAAIGSAVLPSRARVMLVGAAVLCGLVGSAQIPLSHKRTQAAQIARPLRAALQPGDLVVYCPDQTGPAVSRLLPTGTDQVVYPTLGRPERVDWRDYAQRNAKADPQAFARTVLARTRGTIWLVSRGGHLTFGRQCEDLRAALLAGRGSTETVVGQRRDYAERLDLRRYPATTATAATA